jgi:hypothetical protein
MCLAITITLAFLTIPARDILISILLNLGTKSRDYRVVTVVNNNDDGIDGASGTDGGRRTSRSRSLREPLLENETMVPQQDETELVDAPASFRLRLVVVVIFGAAPWWPVASPALTSFGLYWEAVFDSPVAFDTVCVVLVTRKSR